MKDSAALLSTHDLEGDVRTPQDKERTVRTDADEAQAPAVAQLDGHLVHSRSDEKPVRREPFISPLASIYTTILVGLVIGAIGRGVEPPSTRTYECYSCGAVPAAVVHTYQEKWNLANRSMDVHFCNNCAPPSDISFPFEHAPVRGVVPVERQNKVLEFVGCGALALFVLGILVSALLAGQAAQRWTSGFIRKSFVIVSLTIYICAIVFVNLVAGSK